jgi:hypothetical protein
MAGDEPDPFTAHTSSRSEPASFAYAHCSQAGSAPRMPVRMALTRLTISDKS